MNKYLIAILILSSKFSIIKNEENPLYRKKLFNLFDSSKISAFEIIHVGDLEAATFEIPGVYNLAMKINDVEIRGVHNFELSKLKVEEGENLIFEMELRFLGPMGIYGKYSMNGSVDVIKKVEGRGNFSFALHGLVMRTFFGFSNGIIKNYQYIFDGYDRAEINLGNLTIDKGKVNQQLMDDLGKILFDSYEEMIYDKIQRKIETALSNKLLMGTSLPSLIPIFD